MFATELELVQHPAPPQLDRLLQPGRVRSTHPQQRRPSGGMTNTTNLSVEPDQAQDELCEGDVYAPFNNERR
jgi:hypothetical protein